MTRRSCLVVPASSRRKLEKVPASSADEIVLDLEDAVVPSAKDQARRGVTRLIGTATPAVSVRINRPGSPWCHSDVISLGSLEPGPATLVVPKVESSADLVFVDRLLDGVETGTDRSTRVALQALIETARGLSRLDEIAGCSERLEALILGYADLAVSFGRTPDVANDVDGWDVARHDLIMAARAHGLDAIDGPYLGIKPDKAFHAALTRARDLGFDGKWAIHPVQIEPINAAFSPTAAEIERATRVLRALERAEVKQAAGVAVFDGQMLDKPAQAAAQRILERARHAHFEPAQTS